MLIEEPTVQGESHTAYVYAEHGTVQDCAGSGC